jgi:hypothetical protein
MEGRGGSGANEAPKASSSTHSAGNAGPKPHGETTPTPEKGRGEAIGTDDGPTASGEESLRGLVAEHTAKDDGVGADLAVSRGDKGNEKVLLPPVVGVVLVVLEGMPVPKSAGQVLTPCLPLPPPREGMGKGDIANEAKLTTRRAEAEEDVGVPIRGIGGRAGEEGRSRGDRDSSGAGEAPPGGEDTFVGAVPLPTVTHLARLDVVPMDVVGSAAPTALAEEGGGSSLGAREAPGHAGPDLPFPLPDALGPPTVELPQVGGGGIPDDGIGEAIQTRREEGREGGVRAVKHLLSLSKQGVLLLPGSSGDGKAVGLPPGEEERSGIPLAGEGQGVGTRGDRLQGGQAEVGKRGLVVVGRSGSRRHGGRGRNLRGDGGAPEDELVVGSRERSRDVLGG